MYVLNYTHVNKCRSCFFSNNKEIWFCYHKNPVFVAFGASNKASHLSHRTTNDAAGSLKPLAGFYWSQVLDLIYCLLNNPHKPSLGCWGSHVDHSYSFIQWWTQSTHLRIKEVPHHQPQTGCEPKVPGTFKTGYFSTRNRKVPASRCFPLLPKSLKDYGNRDNDTVVQACGPGLLPWQFPVYYRVLPSSRDSMEALALNFESGSCGLNSPSSWVQKAPMLSKNLPGPRSLSGVRYVHGGALACINTTVNLIKLQLK